MSRRRNAYLTRLKLLSPNPTKSLTGRQRQWIKRKGRMFSTLTRKSYARRVLLRATMNRSDLHWEPMWRRGRAMVYAMPTWKYLRPKWYWQNPSAVPGLLKIQKRKFLALHRRDTMNLLTRWLHCGSRITWVRWLQQVRWHQWAWIQRLEHLPHLFLTKTGWFQYATESMVAVKRSQVTLNGFPKGALRVTSYVTQPGDMWSFVSMPQYHQHLSDQSHFWVAQWSTPMHTHASLMGPLSWGIAKW